MLRAALTVLRAHDIAGRPCPSGMSVLGSYEAWSAAVRAPLLWLDEADPALKHASGGRTEGCGG